MSYVERSLGANEKVIARAHFHWSYTLVAVLALIVLGWLLIGIWIFFAMMIPKWTTEIAVTNHRFIKKTGLFSLHTEEIAIPNIEGVEVTQSFWGRILGFGRIRIEGTGVDKTETPLIANPVEFRRAIETAKESGTK
ncbi:MAG: PH domain-containing protein [Proteobacteria bacterium]|nr:PH domain-containing protein [Pseudomonadota bacterium]